MSKAIPPETDSDEKMNLIFAKTIKDGRRAEIFFDGKSLYSAKINGVDAGSGHGIAFVPKHQVYVVGSVGLTAEEKASAESAASAHRREPDRADLSQIRINAVADALRSGNINKYARGGVL